jgi:hypothetical protein
MYTVRTKITQAEDYKNQDFLFYITRNEEFKLMTQLESNKLLEILNKYPQIFKENEIINRDEDDVILLDPNDSDEKEYGRKLSFDFENVHHQISNEDLEDLDNIGGRIVGFDNKYIADRF